MRSVPLDLFSSSNLARFRFDNSRDMNAPECSPSRTGVRACRNVRASALAPPLSGPQAQGLEPRQNEDGDASRNTRAARQAETLVLLISEEGADMTREARHGMIFRRLVRV
jgi:hypothetical protein